MMHGQKKSSNFLGSVGFKEWKTLFISFYMASSSPSSSFIGVTTHCGF